VGIQQSEKFVDQGDGYQAVNYFLKINLNTNNHEENFFSVYNIIVGL
jgi:hypothetical protein